MNLNRNISRILIAMILLVSIITLSSCSTRGGEDNTSSTIDAANVQIVKVSVVGGTYVFDPKVLKKDVQVKLIFDMNTVDGCARSIVIPAFNIRKYVDEKDNAITFTPTKTGTYNIACSMNMYRGTFSVE